MDRRFKHAMVFVVAMSVATFSPSVGQDVDDSRPSGAFTGSSKYPAEVQALMDPTVSPCDNFYRYACGGWLQSYELPANLSTYSYAISQIADAASETLIDIYKQHKPLVSELFESCIDLNQLDAIGTQPVKSMRKQIAKVTTKMKLFRIAGSLSAHGPSFLVSLSVATDPENSTRHVLVADSSKFVVGDLRKFNTTGYDENVEQVYRIYISRLFTLNGVDTSLAAKHAETVIQLQQQIASMVTRNQNKLIAFSKAAAKYPHLVKALAQGLNVFKHSLLKPHDMILMSKPTYFDAIEQFIEDTALTSLKTLLEFQYLDFASQYMGQSFLDARFEFYGRVINGLETPSSREQWCAGVVQTSFPDLVGKYFFETRFDADSEQTASTMIDSIEQAMQNRMQQATWLDEPTREAALKKLGMIIKQIGHSETVEDFRSTLHSKKFFANVKKIRDFKTARSLAKVNQPVDRDEWSMSGATVNAFYRPSTNQIVFPAAILQPPYFSGIYLPEQNYGGIGLVMGHELTHGFDNTGRLFDGDGNVELWWTNQTNAEFAKRAQCLVDQYSRFRVKSEENDSSVVLGKVNGTLTLGENIADNGAFSLAFDALHTQFTQLESSQRRLKQQVTREHNDNHRIHVHVRIHREGHQRDDNLPSDQNSNVLNPRDEHSLDDRDRLFYVSFAQSWCSKNRDEWMKRLLSQTHSPPMFRVHGVIQNDLRFGELFGCPVGTPMNPKNKCQVW